MSIVGNMSYCRFENTTADLRDCKYVLEVMVEEQVDLPSLGESESRKAKELIQLCREIVQIADEGQLDY